MNLVGLSEVSERVIYTAKILEDDGDEILYGGSRGTSIK